MTETMLTLGTDELVLGDEVNLLGASTPYSWGTVVNVTDELVEIHRLYVHIGDFSYTGGVLHYIGTEMVRVSRKSNRTFKVNAYTHKRMTKEGALK